MRFNCISSRSPFSCALRESKPVARSAKPKAKPLAKTLAERRAQSSISLVVIAYPNRRCPSPALQDRPGYRRDVRLFKQHLRRRTTVLVDLLNIRERIEGARRRLASQSSFVESPSTADPAVFDTPRDARRSPRLRRGERMNHCLLYKGAAHAVCRVENNLPQRSHEGLFGHRVSGAPSRHGVRLRKCETRNCALCHPRAAMRSKRARLHIQGPHTLHRRSQSDRAHVAKAATSSASARVKTRPLGILRRVVVDGAGPGGRKTARESGECHCGGRYIVGTSITGAPVRRSPGH